jgi:hypothetical protein
MSERIDSKMDSKKLDLHTQSHHLGSSGKRKVNDTESKNHTLTILDPSMGTFSVTDESDVKSRQTGQRTREKETLEETATVELKERLLKELEATKSVEYFYIIFFIFKIYRKTLLFKNNKHLQSIKQFLLRSNLKWFFLNCFKIIILCRNVLLFLPHNIHLPNLKQ